MEKRREECPNNPSRFCFCGEEFGFGKKRKSRIKKANGEKKEGKKKCCGCRAEWKRERGVRGEEGCGCVCLKRTTVCVEWEEGRRWKGEEAKPSNLRISASGK